VWSGDSGGGRVQREAVTAIENPVVRAFALMDFEQSGPIRWALLSDFGFDFDGSPTQLQEFVPSSAAEDQEAELFELHGRSEDLRTTCMTAL
jgi:hypothetical protein